MPRRSACEGVPPDLAAQEVADESSGAPPVRGALNDTAAAAAEAQLSCSAGDVGEWLGLDSGALPPAGAPAAGAAQAAPSDSAAAAAVVRAARGRALPLWAAGSLEDLGLQALPCPDLRQ